MSQFSQLRVKKPCSNCPFRKDVHPYLSRARVEEMRKQLHIQDQQTFTCHKTVDYSKARPDQSNGAICSGYANLAFKSGRLPVALRFALAAGLIDRSFFGSPELVHDSWAAFVDHHAMGEAC
jgi:hypothetical protein